MQKTLENHQKCHPKSMPKPSNNHEKNDAEKKLKNERPPLSTLGNPGDPRAPVRVTKGLQKDNKRKTTRRRGIQRGACRETNLDPLTRLGRLRARSGYIGADGGSGYPPFRHTKLRVVGGTSPGTASWTRLFQFLTLILELRKTCWYF